ncbi:ficolin-3-like [Acanthaster planci]|uniref:Ficolin-3-like n=1 Tax=Acanthaster planci TaxID=133434 RepID=A0A8B7YUE6_ACAPL|nr:ficolin-3-like [Acanthaster planci]
MAKQNGGLAVNLFALIVFFGTFTEAVGCESRRDSVQKMVLYTAENRALRGVASTKKKVQSGVICGRECNMDKHCKSINFDESNDLCEMSNATRQELGEDLSVKPGSVYFDANENTPSFSLPPPTSCTKWMELGYDNSGVYAIYPEGLNSNGIQVYCDMETDGGGWIVFQRRQDGSVDFYRNSSEYNSGFGNLSGEFWLGNDNLISLTSHGSWVLRVDLEDWENNTAWARYEHFLIPPHSGSRLETRDFNSSSTAFDALTFNKYWAFTTKDNDHDSETDYNCAVVTEGAWWFDECEYVDTAKLNGRYYYVQPSSTQHGIRWYGWHYDVSLKGCSMKIRQRKF